MRNNRHGVIGLALMVAIVLAALLTGACAESAFRTGKPPDQQSMQAAGAAIGGAIAGPPGAAIGGQAGYLAALVFGILAAQRHGAATAAQAKLSAVNTIRPPTTA